MSVTDPAPVLPSPSAEEAPAAAGPAPGTAPAAPPGEAHSPGPAWSLGRRIAFRFVTAYFFLYSLPFPLRAIPGLEFVEESYTRLSYVFVYWLETHVLGFARAVPEPGRAGGGDSTASWLLNLVLLALAAAT